MILRVLDAFRPRGATWLGQVISSPPGPSGGPSKTHLLPGGGVPRVHRARSPVLPRLPRFATPRSVHQFAAVAAGAYPLRRPPNAWSPGPVLLACRQWDPLGLARRLPSLGVGAWRCAPLLPWRVQCPVCVCAALAAGSGVSGRYLVLCLSRFPLPAPRVPRCVWRAVPSGCPLPSLAGTPFHAVCAFRALGPVALLVVPACPLRVCALALPRRPLPPPLGGVAYAPRVVPALGAGRAVPRGPCPSACPAPVPCSVWRALGGGGPVPAPPYLAWGCGGGGRASPGGVPSTVARGVWRKALPLPRLPAHWAGCWGPRSTCCGRGCARVGALLCPLGLHALWGLRAAGRVRGVRVPGGGLGGGGGRAPYPPFVRPGGACRAGGRYASFRPSAFPGQATKRVSLASCCPWGAWPLIPLRFVLARLLWARSVRRPGALARARLFSAVPVGAGGWGGGAGRAPAPLSGGGGTIPPASGGGGRGPRGLRAGGGVGGGGRAAASLLPFLVAACGTQSWPPSCRRRTPFRRARAVGVAVPPRGGGGEGRPVDRSPGGPCKPEPPLCPP